MGYKDLKWEINKVIDSKIEDTNECTSHILEHLIDLRANMQEVLFFKNFLGSLDKNDNY